MSGKKTILVIDDEPDIIKWLTLLFNENGYDTLTASDGTSGYDMAEQKHPDLITLDLSMNNGSGIKMYSRMLKSDKLAKIPVIMVTAASEKVFDFMKRLKSKKPPEGYFEKPVDKDELLDKVKELIG